jgi:hypothetical protein
MARLSRLNLTRHVRCFGSEHEALLPLYDRISPNPKKRFFTTHNSSHILLTGIVALVKKEFGSYVRNQVVRFAYKKTIDLIKKIGVGSAQHFAVESAET